ncbi:T9SS type A sorting domain-containing protein [Hymenobacter cellulosilyticus]|uniref:T9SS type A sorting domain-containing protein n=1 Tax=Hymenobacter cellulosilyticus TaxID=2932248 RepID=A0A8T9Q0X0_9BACT|nr:T9SS type A sorting domain-containing protein [Hymenobacter cellulosilyticus]UOQ71416.1 T9SS type A sorting domain-containing protein [Hymenobacter cellulosilyticus]
MSSSFLHSSVPFLLRAAALFLLGLLSAPTARAQTMPTWQQAVPVAQASGGSTVVMATTTDAAGNVYLTGIFYGTVTLGSQTLVSNGQADIFVAKWSSATSSYVWATGGGGSRIDVATGVAVNGNSVYVTGSFIGSISFGGTTLTNSATTIDSDVFVAKLTDAGTTASWTWAQQAGGTLDDYAGAVVVNGPNIYLSGTSRRQATFGGISINNPAANVFVAKMVDAGPTAAFTWVKSSGGSGLERAPALAMSGSSLYVAGVFYDTTIFGTTTLTNASPGNPDLFVAKLTDAGTSASFEWARSAGGPEYDEALALAVNGANVYVSGYFHSSSISFGATTLANANTNPGFFTPDVFVAKLTDAGTTASWTWAQQAGGPNIDEARALAVSGNQVYVTGSFNSASANFGATTLANIAADGTSDIFVARLTDAGSTGSITWAQQAGGTNGDVGRALTVRGTTVYVAGEAGGASRFGSQTLPSPASTYGGFWASFSDLTITSTHRPAPLALAFSPNPASNLVQLPGLPAGTPVQFLDALGRIARATTISAATQVSVRGLAPGLYTLRATDVKGQQFAGKVVVE